MWLYGDVALGAIKRVQSGTSETLSAAWKAEAQKVFPHSPTLQTKGCPRAAFFGLCEEGLVLGVPKGSYNRSSTNKNKGYVVEAVQQLIKEPQLAQLGPTALWERVLDGHIKQANSQMHMLLTLWKQGRIDKSQVRRLTKQVAKV